MLNPFQNSYGKSDFSFSIFKTKCQHSTKSNPQINDERFQSRTNQKSEPKQTRKHQCQVAVINNGNSAQTFAVI